MSDSLLKQVLAGYETHELLEALPPHLREYLPYCWEAVARPEQLLPDDKPIMFMLMGRRCGKTRSAAEWVRSRVERGIARQVMIVAPTHNDLITDMLNGPSGLITRSPPGAKPHFKTTDNTLNWPNGARAICLSAEEPERTRGKEVDTVWCDEIAAWRYGEEVWNLIPFCAGRQDMRILVTTTPKPTPLVRRILAEAHHIVRGTTFDNADNLSSEQLASLKAKHEGTHLGRQELYAEIIDEVPGAFWTRAILDACRRRTGPKSLRRVVVAVDPSGGAGESNDEQGIVVVGLGDDEHGYVLEDCSCKLSPDGWGQVAVKAYDRHQADRIVYEKNYGGEMVEHVITTAARKLGMRVNGKFVSASRGKVVRAEPCAALYEQGRVHHVGSFPRLEEQLCWFTPSGEFQESPDRADALVWAITELMLHDPIILGDEPIAYGVRRIDVKPNDVDEDDDDADYGGRGGGWRTR